MNSASVSSPSGTGAVVVTSTAFSGTARRACDDLVVARLQRRHQVDVAGERVAADQHELDLALVASIRSR